MELRGWFLIRAHQCDPWSINRFRAFDVDFTDSSGFSFAGKRRGSLLHERVD